MIPAGANQCGRANSALHACLPRWHFLPSPHPTRNCWARRPAIRSAHRANWFFDEGVRVGSFSHLDEILPHYTLSKAATPLPLAAAAGDAEDRAIGSKTRACTLDDFLAHQRVTGLLLIKDGEILVERYQYDRKPTDRFISHSMAKSIVSLAVGMALAEGKIASLDDTGLQIRAETRRQSLWRDHDTQYPANVVRRAVQRGL